jgi:hypothetical protein
LLKIILVVAIFSESLKSVIIKIRVGNVVKSVGLGIYKDIRIIKTESEREMVRKKSSTELGSGTMIIAKIDIISATTVKSLARKIGSIYGTIRARILCLDLANQHLYSLRISLSVMVSKKSSILV